MVDLEEQPLHLGHGAGAVGEGVVHGDGEEADGLDEVFERQGVVVQAAALRVRARLIGDGAARGTEQKGTERNGKERKGTERTGGGVSGCMGKRCGGCGSGSSRAASALACERATA